MTLSSVAVTLVAKVQVALPTGNMPEVRPRRDGLPGGNAIGTLLGWGMYLALAGCILGAIGAGAAIGLGNLSSRPQWAERGKIGLVCAIIGAIVIGSAVTMVNTGFGMG